MSKELIVSVNGREKKIAIVEDDVVTEFYVERGDENQGIVGNIYKGRVMKVLPGMQSAFVDIGLERDSFLYVSDFLDEEEDLDEDAAEPRRETARPARRERYQQPREVLIEVAAEAEEDDQEAELAAAALYHIAELAEEPVLEPAPDDEILTAVAEEVEPEPNARYRRQRRLRYQEPEPEAEPAAPSVAPAFAEESVSTEETGGRRRSRNRRRRGRDASFEVNPSEVASAEEVVESVAEGAEDVGYTPLILAHHEPFERVTDDDLAALEGDMLKDALVQEKITERIHAEEYRTSLLEVEPTPEVTVGSLHQALPQSHGFERISDDPEPHEEPVAELAAEEPAQVVDTAAEAAPIGETLAEAPVEAPPVIALETPASAEPVAEAAAPEVPAPIAPTVRELTQVAVAEVAVAPTAEPQPEAPEVEAEAPAEAPTQPLAATPESVWPETDRRARELLLEPLGDGRRITKDLPPGETPAEARPAKKNYTVLELQDDVEVLPLAPPESDDSVLEDASATVRQRPKRGEFAATRRGGRGRRRQYRRQPAADATAEAEDAVAVEEREPAPPPPLPAPIAPAPRINGRQHRPVISDLLREGQEILVQIAKEPIGQKGARITSHVALPGRYIVYMPTVEHIGVSRKIGTDEERQRLKRTLHQLRAESAATGGFIVRTAAHGCTAEELRDDMQYLLRTWTDMRRRSDRAKAPAIVHRDLDLVQRILRDQLSGEFSAIRVDNEFEYERIVDFVNRFAPKLVNRVKLYTKDTPILEHYGVQQEIDKAVKPRVWLRSGGYIVINQTEALVAIDVNTGKFVGKSNRLEDTIVRTNLEAAKEIVRQIRLRDLGGIIVLDFIDMEERRNRQRVMQALEQELRSDKSPSKILQFNDFGLVAITRKRVKQSLERTLCTPCAYCGGGGMVKSAQTIAYEILAEARRVSKEIDAHNEVILRVNPEVAKALRSSERDVLTEIESYLGGVVTIKSDPTVHQEQFDIALV